MANHSVGLREGARAKESSPEEDIKCLQRYAHFVAIFSGTETDFESPSKEMNGPRTPVRDSDDPYHRVRDMLQDLSLLDMFDIFEENGIRVRSSEYFT